MNQQKIGDFIKRKRKEKGLTQTELAEKLGITNQAISKWERGKNCPDISLLKDLCKILNIDINELLSGKELDKVSKEDSEDILVETVRTYTNIEKKKNKKLLIFTLLLLIFYVFLVIGMYLTFNQTTKTNGTNWEILQTKKMSERLFTYLENYDYSSLKKLYRKQFPNNYTLYENEIENEDNCDKYLKQYRNGESASDWGIICRLKDFENNDIKFKSHKFSKQYYSGMGNFFVNYDVIVSYNNIDTKINVSISTHNGVFNEFVEGIDTGGVVYPGGIELIKKGYTSINSKIMNFFFFDDEYYYMDTVK